MTESVHSSITEDRWEAVRGVLSRALPSSLHGAVASVGADGRPYVTPVGSLMLHERARISYFELFAAGLGRRLDANPNVSVLLVDSGKARWLRALVRGEFQRRPAIRLHGQAGAPRPATERERERFLRRVRGIRHLPGGRTLWSRTDALVRDIHIERIDDVRLGGMSPRSAPAV